MSQYYTNNHLSGKKLKASLKKIEAHNKLHPDSAYFNLCLKKP
jgi:hypothetical protein